MLRRKTMAKAAVCVLLAATLAGCAGSGGTNRSGAQVETQSSADADLQKIEMYAMDTYMQLFAYGANAKEALSAAKKEIASLDQMLAAQKSGSEVAKINREGGGTLSDTLAELIRKSLELHRMTDGKFEIAIYPVKQLWGFDTKQYRVPGQQEIGEKLPLADSTKIDLKGNTLKFGLPGMEIELGAIAKGYASEKIKKIFSDYHVNGMVNLGGNVQVYGTKQNGAMWRVGIRVPKQGEENSYVGVLQTDHEAVITSGSSERFFEKNGKIYHHIIDPDTGYPSESGLLSATIISEDGTLADGLSTAMFIFGKERAEQFWRQHADQFQMILIDSKNHIYATDGLKGRFESEQTIFWITK